MQVINFNKYLNCIVLVLLFLAIEISPYFEYYEYDKNMALNAEIAMLRETDNVIIYKVYYDSPMGGRVPALLSIPKSGEPSFPCIIFLHGYGGKKENILDATDYVAQLGYAVFAIDAQYHGERKVPGVELYSPNFTRTINGIIQTVIDLRRGIDFLETVEKIDSSRIGYLGASMGGILGAIFISVEPRVKAAVLIVPGGNMSLMIKESKHPSVSLIREYIQKTGLSYDYLQKMLDPIDPINFIEYYSPRPVQFHCGVYDDIVPAEACRQLYDRAREPKEIYWYESGHALKPEELVVLRAINFFNKHLKAVKPTKVENKEYYIVKLENIPDYSLLILLAWIILLSIATAVYILYKLKKI